MTIWDFIDKHFTDIAAAVTIVCMMGFALIMARIVNK